MLTGCNSGLGLETLRVLTARGARVLGTARSEAKAALACGDNPARSRPLACDLAEPASVRACVATVKSTEPKLDAIICNAGIMALPRLQQAYGYELQFFTNHIGHFLLVTGLLERLAERGRVVVLSSEAHRRTRPGGIQFDNLSGERGYTPWRAYGQSKLANLLFARELAGRLPERGQRANALHPGVIPTNLTRHMPEFLRAGMRVLAPLGFKSVPEGAATQCYLAARSDITVNGEYFVDCNVGVSSRHGRDRGLAAQLWAASERIAREL